MALKSGRVGVRNDQVDAYGRLKTIDTDLTVNGSFFVNEEIEFLDADGDFGENAKARISEVGLSYTTSAPTEANTDGLKIVVLTSEPATKYDGWLYFITEA